MDIDPLEAGPDPDAILLQGEPELLRQQQEEEKYEAEVAARAAATASAKKVLEHAPVCGLFMSIEPFDAHLRWDRRLFVGVKIMVPCGTSLPLSSFLHRETWILILCPCPYDFSLSACLFFFRLRLHFCDSDLFPFLSCR